jgi:hypothetical protein
MQFEFPRKAERAHIKRLDVAAVFVAVVVANVGGGDGRSVPHCIVKSSRDLEQSQQKGCPGMRIVAAFWVKDSAVADAIAATVGKLRDKDNRGLAADVEGVQAAIEVAATAQGVKLIPHVEFMRLVARDAAKVKTTVAAAHKSGELKWFNKAFREYRLRGGAMLYGAAKNKLYGALTRRLMFAGQLDLDTRILPEVFGS